MICSVNYQNSTGIVRDWLSVKYQVINNCFGGMTLGDYYGKPEILYDVGCPGSRLFFHDEYYERMKAAGYFIGKNGKHMGEGGAEVTEQTLAELKLDQEQMNRTAEQLLQRGFRLFMERDDIESEARTTHDGHRRNYLLRIYGLYLIPQKEIPNIPNGTLLISSTDAREIVLNGTLDWDLKEGFSKYGIRLMPVYIEDALLKDE